METEPFTCDIFICVELCVQLILLPHETSILVSFIDFTVFATLCTHFIYKHFAM